MPQTSTKKRSRMHTEAIYAVPWRIQMRQRFNQPLCRVSAARGFHIITGCLNYDSSLQAVTLNQRHTELD